MVRGEPVAQGLEIRRPRAGLEAPLALPETGEAEPAGGVRRDPVDLAQDLRIRRLRAPALEILHGPLGLTCLRSPGIVEVGHGAGQLVVEIVGEPRGRGAQARLHPLALQVAHLADPAVLESGQGDQEDEEQGGDRERAKPAHRSEDSTRPGPRPARFTFLTNSLRRLGLRRSRAAFVPLQGAAELEVPLPLVERDSQG